MPLYIAIYSCYLFLSCWKLILGEGVSKLFRNTPSVLKHVFCFETPSLLGGRRRSSNIQESAPPPLRSTLPQRPTASNGSVHKCFLPISQFPLFLMSKDRRDLSSYFVLPQPLKPITLLTTPPPSMDFGVSRFILDLFGSNCRNSYPYYKPCISSKVVVGQSVIQPQEPCRT